MEPLCLADVSSLPAAFIPRLKEVDSVFQAHEHIDSVTADPRVRPLALELNEHLRRVPIRAYHCTREPVPGYFAREGLRLTNVEAHQNEFLTRFGNRFTDSEIEDMRTEWHDYFVRGGQARHRNGLIWFCLTEATARSEGTEVFFEHFGGEAIFMPLKRHQTIPAKLGAIGMPVVVEVRLQPGAHSSYMTLALPLLSAYHRTRRPDAEPCPGETHVSQPVAAHDVLSVTEVQLPHAR
ncbi:hypothetical protein [Hydrogenophaga sp.]|uniref:hypothetical protein n=1 Tax=Hydrogenophaga sp. TaxID=1904254 RepID=UPI00273020D0|nr:hypothetical protein [Hydrogenophaga sp.]MDP1684617.1 hypothetical protein [Hydrogenophaga sp.]